MYKIVNNRDNRKVEYLMLKQKDLKRATLIEACIKGQCTVKQVAIALGISERRVKQIKKEVKEKRRKIHTTWKSWKKTQKHNIR